MAYAPDLHRLRVTQTARHRPTIIAFGFRLSSSIRMRSERVAAAAARPRWPGCATGFGTAGCDPAVRDGDWRLLDCAPAWDGNCTCDCSIAWCWQGSAGGRVLIAVNYPANQSQGYVRLPWPDLAGAAVHLRDLMSLHSYDCDGNDLVSRGLFLDLPPWGRLVFEVSALR
jgi:hypothetical protein